MATPELDAKYTTIKEGLAYILVPKDAQTSVDPRTKSSGETQPQSVFYNPIQQFNRDLSVLAIRAYGEDLIGVKVAKAERSRAGRRRKAKKSQHEALSTVANDGQTLPSEDLVNSVVESNRLKRTSEDADLQDPEDAQSGKRLKEGEVENTHGTSLTAATDVHIDEANGEESTGVAPRTRSGPKIKFKVLDALSATGLRALRYSHELPFVTHVTANDLSADATKSIQANVIYNKLEDKIKVVTGNALAHMYSLVNLHTARGPNDNLNKYDVVDLDPYGTAGPFLDASIQAINDGGLLCVTCTDAAIFASVGYPEKTYAQYGGMPIKGLHSHEGGLRLILHSIATTAAKYGMSIEPLLSLSIDFYARVFVRVFRSPAEVKFLAGKTMLVYSCDSGCGAWQTQYIGRYSSKLAKDGTPIYSHGMAQGPTASTFCEHCGFKTHISGPMYGGPLHNPAFIETILSYLPDLDTSTYATTARIEGMLSTALEETLIQGDPEAAVKQQADKTNSNAEDDNNCKPARLVPRMDPAEQDRHPFFWFPSALAKVLHARAPSEAEVKGALRHAGYRAVRSHTKPGSIRTDAPWTFIWQMMREWVRQKAPIKEDSIKPGQAGWKIMRGSVHQMEGVGARGESEKTKGVAEAEQNVEDVQQKVDGSMVEDDRTGISALLMKTAAQSETKRESKKEIVFDEQLGREGGKKEGRRLVRYQVNPRANWGPMVRAKKGVQE